MVSLEIIYTSKHLKFLHLFSVRKSEEKGLSTAELPGLHRIMVNVGSFILEMMDSANIHNSIILLFCGQWKIRLFFPSEIYIPSSKQAKLFMTQSKCKNCRTWQYCVTALIWTKLFPCSLKKSYVGALTPNETVFEDRTFKVIRLSEVIRVVL